MGKGQLPHGDLRGSLTPVVVLTPVADECLDLRQLHSLRLISDSFLVTPSRRQK